MLPFSIIIITKNEERNIARCLTPLAGLTNDLIVMDSDSTDNTCAIAAAMGAKVMNVEWQGYSQTKNNAHAYAKYDWILSLDADEEMTIDLKKHIEMIFSEGVEEDKAYLIRRKLVYCGQVLHYGSVSNEYRTRLYNKKFACWNQNEVHEDIEFHTPAMLLKLQGYVLHHSSESKDAHQYTLEKYAHLFARQKIREGRRVSIIKLWLSPVFGFIKNFIFRLGFLDGSKGLEFALAEMNYTRRKYQLIQEAH